ncbi:hypothetical protein AK812_SmicGene46165 [Symbiodinium microadriaticum]|uniref:Uncharacterized protein n=1 Tax=Symbiodinium microadriaticum TaxID=2951 RepID=A0A1Q9BUF7_SYMMI|nr:hypothetical protein AK812_SmicGene46165 [Symbiodinium microadriaticum]
MVGRGFLVLGSIGVASHGADFPSLLVAMLARDEEALLKKHLPAWKQVGDSFLLGLDSRTQALEGVMVQSTTLQLWKP